MIADDYRHILYFTMWVLSTCVCVGGWGGGGGIAYEGIYTYVSSQESQY